MHGDYALPVLLVSGRVGVAGGRPCPDAWPLVALEPSRPSDDLPASGHAWLPTGLLLVADDVAKYSEPGRAEGDSWTTLDVRRRVYRFGEVLLNDGYFPGYGGTACDSWGFEVLESSPPSDDRRASEFVYPRLHLLTDASSDPRMSLPPPAASSVFNPAQAR
jgi:hypothetical protein